MIAPTQDKLCAAGESWVASTDDVPGMPVGRWLNELTYRDGYYIAVAYRFSDSTELPRFMFPATRRGARLARQRWREITGQSVALAVTEAGV